MAKIPFNIKYRPQIESGEYKVETRDGRLVSILAFDIHFRGMSHMILAEHNECYDCWPINGRYNRCATDCNLDLFLITPEPELSKFEERVKQLIGSYPCANKENRESLLYEVQKAAAELLALARKEIEKDLPRWKKCEDGNTDRLELEALCQEAGSPIEIAFRANGYRIFLSDLEKLQKEE